MKNLIGILFFSSIITVKAQTGSIQGYVKTPESQPVAHVNLSLMGERKGASTDGEGFYQITGLKAGRYVLIATFVGFQPVEKTIAVEADQVTQLDFELIELSQGLSEVEVVGTRGLNEQPLSLGKIAINPMELPQSTMVLDRAFVEKQQSNTLGEVLMNANGVYVMGTTGGTQQELAGRGFSFGSSNTFKNGVRFNNGIMPEISALERVEILKGSGALLFGQVGAGGVLNIVTKKPKFEQGGEFGFRVGSYNAIKPYIDLYGSLDKKEQVAYRMNAVYENSGSFRNSVQSERIYFNPSILIQAGKRTDLLIEADYLKDNRTLDFGTAAINYEIADVPRSRFLNTSWAYYKAEQKSATLTVKHSLSDAWQLRFMGSYQSFEQDQYGTTRPNASGAYNAVALRKIIM
jgi:iron complex outermembrane receptor protein